MYDYLQAAFWSLTYIPLIVYAFRYRKHGIPLIAVCLNYAWEAVALLQSFNLGPISAAGFIHLSWFGLDTVIFMLYLFHETPMKENLRTKLGWISFWIAAIISNIVLFSKGYMLLFSFVIDLIMAIAFVFFAYRKTMRGTPLGVAIGITKLLGDMFAWLHYRNPYYEDSRLVNLIGMVVLGCNIVYVLIELFKSSQKGATYDQSI